MTELQQIEKDIEMCEAMISKKDKLMKLYEVPEFKELILEDYFKDEANRLVGMLAHKQHKEVALKELEAISVVRYHLSTIEVFADQAAEKLEELKEARIELLAEGV